MDKEESPGATIRALMRLTEQSALSTSLARDESDRPYVSLVLVAVGHDGAPLLLLSDLADHTRNIARDPRVALLFDGTGGWQDPLAGPRASVLGHAVKEENSLLLERFTRRHPGAKIYVEFQDFNLYRVEVESAHLVAGFGRIDWAEAREVLFDITECQALAAAEAEIVDHMNRDHGDAVDLIVSHQIIEMSGSEMIGIDPEGFDVRTGETIARVGFERPVRDPESARAELVRMTKEARDAGY